MSFAKTATPSWAGCTNLPQRTTRGGGILYKIIPHGGKCKFVENRFKHPLGGGGCKVNDCHRGKPEVGEFCTKLFPMPWGKM